MHNRKDGGQYVGDNGFLDTFLSSCDGMAYHAVIFRPKKEGRAKILTARLAQLQSFLAYGPQNMRLLLL